ncbi:MAG: zinc-dependent peptidase, partial [Thiolinea sp.]
RIKQFIHEKHFTGCAGLELTDEMRVTIAACACLLILNRKTSVYPGLRYILVYPEAFLVQRDALDETGLAAVRKHSLLGESWDNGKVILSWEDVIRGSRDAGDGSNVALHEFAHQLDHESGATNGAPVLGSAAGYKRWARVLTAEFEDLQRAAYQGDETLLDYYGATEPAEFFAVVTEVFFERPKELAQRHPALFEQLRGYFRVNPAEWRIQ